jgi:hypothetical protein
MQHYEFVRTVSVERKRFKAGAIVREDELLAGDRETMLRLGQIQPCDAPAELEQLEQAGEQNAAGNVEGDEATLEKREEEHRDKPELDSKPKGKPSKPSKAKASKPSKAKPSKASPETASPAEPDQAAPPETAEPSEPSEPDQAEPKNQDTDGEAPPADPE